MSHLLCFVQQPRIYYVFGPGQKIDSGGSISSFRPSRLMCGACTYICENYCTKYPGRFYKNILPTGKKFSGYSLSHFFPSECSSYPMSHAHSYPPSVLTHEWLQPWSMDAHSSNSFMNVAEKPAFCTELSDSKMTRSLFEVDLK